MPEATNQTHLMAALLDFAGAPGRHALRMGQPTVLFEALDTLALWAVGRVPVDAPEPDRLRQAALFFVTRACFAPDNTHYQWLGLRPHEVSAQRLRTRYRALIGLTHPDRAIAGLPEDAAGMINRAHAVLGDTQLRAAYDDQLARQLERSLLHASARTPQRPPSASPRSSGPSAGGNANSPTDRRAGRAEANRTRPGAPAPKAAPSAASLRSTGPMNAVPGRNLARRAQAVPTQALHIGQASPLWVHRWSPATLRLLLSCTVLLLVAAAVLWWGLEDKKAERRLVVAEHSASTGWRDAEPTETVRLRIPETWSRGVDLPLAEVRMQDAPPGAAVPGAVGLGAASAGVTAAAGPSGLQNNGLGTAPKGASAAGPASAAWALPPAAPASTPKSSAPAASVSPAALTSSSSASAPSSPASVSAAPPASGSLWPQWLSKVTASLPAPSTGASAGSSTGAATGAATATPTGTAAPSSVPAALPTAKSPDKSPDKAPDRVPLATSALADSAIIWDVDLERARAYLKELLNQLEKPEQARSTNQYLQGMKVNGSLLRPAPRALRVLGAELIETHQPGVLRLRGVLQAQSDGAERQARPVRFVVQAEFRGTHQGTVLTLLDMKESE